MNNIQGIGHIGEKIIRQYFKSIGIENIFQADWIIYINDKYRLCEIKYQDIFEPPPFYGHGLPPWQIESRIKFYHRTRIEPYLYIVEKSDFEKKENYHLIWCQSLIKLELTDYYQTEINPRKIYNIKNYERIYFLKNEKDKNG